MSFLERLDLETRSYHAAADRWWSRLLAPGITKWQYIHCLVRAYGFDAPVEASLAYTPRLRSVCDLRRHFRSGLIAQDLLELGLSAAELGPQRSARLMAVLPDPRNRSPVSGTAFIARRGAQIERGAATIRQDGRAACFL